MFLLISVYVTGRVRLSNLKMLTLLPFRVASHIFKVITIWSVKWHTIYRQQPHYLSMENVFLSKSCFFRSFLTQVYFFCLTTNKWIQVIFYYSMLFQLSIYTTSGTLAQLQTNIDPVSRVCCVLFWDQHSKKSGRQSSTTVLMLNINNNK